jgi:Uma2 family endonuclease
MVQLVEHQRERASTLTPPATLAEYLTYWPEGEPPYYEFINGKAVQMPSPTFQHQNILMELASQMRTFAKQHHLGVVVPAPMDVYLRDEEYYQPDIIFVSNERRAIIEKYINGAPDLVVEILSPNNAYHDLIHKKRVYEQYDVQEYWIVAPDDAGVEVYGNSENGFQLISKAYTQGTVRSAVLEGFELDVAQLFS